MSRKSRKQGQICGTIQYNDMVGHQKISGNQEEICFKVSLELCRTLGSLKYHVPLAVTSNMAPMPSNHCRRWHQWSRHRRFCGHLLIVASSFRVLCPLAVTFNWLLHFDFLMQLRCHAIITGDDLNDATTVASIASTAKDNGTLFVYYRINVSRALSSSHSIDCVIFKPPCLPSLTTFLLPPMMS